MDAMRVGTLLGVLALGISVAGCSNADEPAVRAAASSFAGGDDRTRCGLLAPATLESLEQDGSCPEALGQLDVGSGDVVSVHVWGSDALVHLSDDTLFLTRDDAGWRVSAAACRPTGEGLPYECQLEAS